MHGGDIFAGVRCLTSNKPFDFGASPDLNRCPGIFNWNFTIAKKFASNSIHNEKSAQRRRKHCALAVVAEPKIFAPPETPFPGAQDGQNLISWRWSLPLRRNPVW